MTPQVVMRVLAKSAPVTLALALSSCTYVWVGHRIDPARVREIKIGMTTEQFVREAFGRPDTETAKAAQGVRVLTYRNVRHTELGLPFPFLQVRKAADRGYVLNVILKDGIVADYEFVHVEGTYVRAR